MGGRGQSSNQASAGRYKPWEGGSFKNDKERDAAIGGWKLSSSYIRHAINGRDGKPSESQLEEARKLDNYLNSGSYTQTIYRGKRLTKEQLSSIAVGDIINQDGPASFSKSISVAQSFARGGFNNESGASQRTVFVLEGGTKAGRDIQSISGFSSEQEVAVGSSSHMKVTKIETKIEGGLHYTYVYGKEIKKTFKSTH